jgi:hypothetical protein
MKVFTNIGCVLLVFGVVVAMSACGDDGTTTEPTLECDPGVVQCTDAGLQACGGDAMWLEAVPCAEGELCTEGACVAEPTATDCTEGDLQCADGGVQTCSADGTWGETVPCADGETCEAGACMAPPTDCDDGDVQCGADGGVQACTEDGTWGEPVACPEGQVCNAGTCAEPPKQLCMDLAECAVAACVEATSDEVNDCISAAYLECGEADSEADLTAAGDLIGCWNDNGCMADGGEDYYSCWGQHCVTETATCVTSEFQDSLTCGKLGGCMVGCVDMFLGVWDWPCIQSCMNQGSQTAVEFYWANELCVLHECQGSEDFQACRQSVEGNVAFCGGQANNCAGDEF